MIKVSDILNIVGNRIRQFRTAKNLSQEELALKANVDPTHIGRIERGVNNASIEMLNKIITAMGISLEDFFKQTQQPYNTDDEVLSNIIAKLILLNKDEKESMLEFVTNYKLLKKK